ncbi:MAG: right-handed parallel beta-helix repeat-containing protein [Nitrospira sp.]|nr:right-handed parallel beta-helix repeat-containing protein [Nitrospira sp.]
MTRLKRAIGAWMLASTLLPSVATHATTYYVATTGNNSNLGTEAQPWQTVAHAVNTMAAGDMTYVRGGTYHEGLIQFKRSGTRAAPIKLLNYPGESPIIDFIDKTQFHRILIQHSSGTNVAMGWITIQGFEIRDGYNGIKFHSLHNSVIRRNWIHHNVSQGIMGQGGHHNLFDQNIINHNGNFAGCAARELTPIGTTICNQQHGLYMHGDSYTITNNLIYDNLAYGITHNGSSTSTYSQTRHAAPEFAGAANWIIANNTFAYQNHRGGIVVWGSECTNARIENNIFYENSVNQSGFAQGIDFVSSTSTGITIRNNLAYATSPGSTVFLGSGANEWVHYTQSGNLVNVRNPGFVNAPATLPASPNFALTARSPAIDAGLPLATVKIDFNGTPRPQGHTPDIGAYEYSPGGDVEPPTTPTTLGVNRKSLN